MSAGDINLWLSKKTFGGKKKIAIYRKLAKYIAGGISLPLALKTLQQFASEDGRKPKAEAAIMFGEWLKVVENGGSFAKALDGWVGKNDCSVIMAGEKAGRLDKALESAAFLAEANGRMSGAIIAGSIYPFFLCSLLGAFLVMISVMVVPNFDEVIPKEQWTGGGAILYYVSEAVTQYSPYVLTGLISLVIGSIISLPHLTGKLRSALEWMVPYNIYKTSAGAGFMISLATMVRAGRPVDVSVRMLRDMGNKYVAERLTDTLRYLDNGKNIGEALFLTRHKFPDKETISDLRSYASLPKFEESLERLGRESIEAAIARINSQLGMLRNVIFILIGISLGSVYLGVFSLQSQITTGINAQID